MRILVLDDDKNRMTIFKSNIENRLHIKDADYVYTETEAIDKLKSKVYNYVFLDHDLGGHQMTWDDSNCGMNVVDWMIENHNNKRANVIIHSYNIPRAHEMYLRLNDAGYEVTKAPGVWNILG